MMAINLIYGSTTGTDDDDFMLPINYYVGNNATINAGGGDDLVLGDMGYFHSVVAVDNNGDIASAYSLEIDATWTMDENPLFGNAAVPHTSVVAEATIGAAEYYSVSVGAGETITVDIDFGYASPIGLTDDLVVEIRDGAGNIIASNSGTIVTDGGLGSFHEYDPYVSYTPTAGGTYYVSVRPFGAATFSANTTYMMNVSVSGHATTANTPVGNDVINGGDGDDSLFGQGGDDTINGDDGDDTIHGGSGLDTINGGLGNDILRGGDENDTTNNVVHGNDGDDVIYSTGNGYYYGDANNDTIHAGSTVSGVELLDGGDGIDTLNTTHWNFEYIINMATGETNYSYLGESFINFENIITGNGNTTVTGTSVSNIIRTGNGNDSIDGGAGADTMEGGAGDDVYYVDNGLDVVTETSGGGSDRVLASVSYSLGTFSEVEYLWLANASATTALNLTGSNSNQQIIGNSGNNIIDGLGGADEMRGGAGDDRYYVDNIGDRVFEAAGGGADRLLTSISYTLTAGQYVEYLWASVPGDTTNINLFGNDFNQQIIGNAGNNIINGLGGADEMRGGAGNDTYYVENAGDRVFEAVGGGNDIILTSVSLALTAGQEVETLATNNMSGLTPINLWGNALDNIIAGNAAANLLDGLGGNDTLSGGGGADHFRFTTAIGAGNVDRLPDFVSGTDKIVLENAIFSALAAGSLGSGAYYAGAAAHDADDRIIYNPATGALFYDADGSGAGAAVRFAQLNTGLVLSAGDFIVV